ncbi:hypothetical protein PybrP1_008736, partial [[Pythium] brassicae (nom. inval.)]
MEFGCRRSLHTTSRRAKAAVILLHQDIARLREARNVLQQRALLTRVSPNGSLVRLARELYTVMQYGLETALISQWRKHTAAYSKFRIEVDDVEVIYDVGSSSSVNIGVSGNFSGVGYGARGGYTGHDGVGVKRLSLGNTSNRKGMKHERSTSGGSSGDGSDDGGNASDS